MQEMYNYVDFFNCSHLESRLDMGGPKVPPGQEMGQFLREVDVVADCMETS